MDCSRCQSPFAQSWSSMRKITPGDSALAARLRREIRGEVLFDAASRGRYSTDASIYQIEPVGVVVPETEEDALAALRIAIEEGVPVLPRGGGHFAVRPDGRRRARHRSLQAPEPDRGVRQGGAHGHRAAGRRARSVERVPEAARLVVSGRRVHQRAGDARRHGGQQLLRLALDPLRQHGAQRARDRRGDGRRRRVPLRRGAGRRRASSPRPRVTSSW